jgi:hypothetical protein
MKNRRNRNTGTLNSYCRLIVQATDLGVPLDDYTAKQGNITVIFSPKRSEIA